MRLNADDPTESRGGEVGSYPDNPGERQGEMQENRNPGTCHVCKKPVGMYQGVVEPPALGRGRWLVWCMACYNTSDNSGSEDRCCGDRAYEDQCARACER